MSHSEVKTGLTLKSGSDPAADKLGVMIGGKFMFDRGHRMFWKIRHDIEKNLFKGTANTNDPVTTFEGIRLLPAEIKFLRNSTA